MASFNEKIKELKKEIPYKWRAQSIVNNGESFSCVAYIDARDAMNRLDEVFGADGWQDHYGEIKGNLFCTVLLKDDEGNWLARQDTGTESAVEKEKGESSDAFKRACVKWGLGRFLYDLKPQYVSVEVSNGKKLPNRNEINKLNASYSGDRRPSREEMQKTARPKNDSQATARPNNDDQATAKQIATIKSLFLAIGDGQRGPRYQKMIDGYGVTSTTQLSKAQASDVIERLVEIKEGNNG